METEPEDLEFISKKFVDDDDFDGGFDSEFTDEFGSMDIQEDENLKFSDNEDFPTFGDDYDDNFWLTGKVIRWKGWKLVAKKLFNFPPFELERKFLNAWR